MSKFCAKCGADIAPNAGFCPLCGFSTSTPLPVATPEKAAVKPQPVPKAPIKNEPKKKSPVNLIAVILAIVSTIAAIILLILLLIPDNKCDFCGEKADHSKETLNKTVVDWCKECDGICTLCGKGGAELDKIASGETVFMCYDCRKYIESNMVKDVIAPESTQPDNNIGNDSAIIIPGKTERTTVPSNTPSENDGSNSNRTDSSNSTTLSNSESTTQVKESQKITYRTDGTLISNGYELKVKTFESNSNSTKSTNVTFVVTQAPSASKGDNSGKDDNNKEIQSFIIYYKALDESGKELKSNITVSANFNKTPGVNDVSNPVVLEIPDNTAMVEFYVKSNNNQSE